MRISEWSSDVCSSDLGGVVFTHASGSLLGKSVSGEFRSQWSNAKLAGCGIRIVRIRSRDVQDACPGGYLGSLRTICRKRVERGHRRDTVAAPARTGRLRWKEDRDMTMPARPFLQSDTHGIVLRPENRIYRTSGDLGWSSVFVSEQREQPFAAEVPAAGAHLIVLHLGGPVVVRGAVQGNDVRKARSEEHTSELQSLLRITSALFPYPTPFRSSGTGLSNARKAFSPARTAWHRLEAREPHLPDERLSRLEFRVRLGTARAAFRRRGSGCWRPSDRAPSRRTCRRTWRCPGSRRSQGRPARRPLFVARRIGIQDRARGSRRHVAPLPSR